LPFTGWFGDPYSREAKTFFDGVKYRFPVIRQTLPAKRDFLGQPIMNPQYGNILRRKPAQTDPVALEMDRLDIHPAPPVNKIGTIQLPKEMYEDYQELAGLNVRHGVEELINAPDWEVTPRFLQEVQIRGAIRAGHATAAAVMQGRYQRIIDAGMENVERRLRGEKPIKKLPEPAAP
jgi:hypothetical protein